MKNENKKNAADDHNAEVKTTLVSHNITVLGKRTSIRLEPEMWSALREICKIEKCRISDICSLVSLRKNRSTSLTGAIRVFMMLYYRAAASDEGHKKAGHGNFGDMIRRAGVSPEFFPRYAGQEANKSAPASSRPAGHNESGRIKEMSSIQTA